MGTYFIFECQNQVPSTVNFNMVRIWVRIQDLPWSYLNTDWTVRILSHVGLVKAIDDDNQGFHHHPFLRARLVFDIKKPLIPGCFFYLLKEIALHGFTLDMKEFSNFVKNVVALDIILEDAHYLPMKPTV